MSRISQLILLPACIFAFCAVCAEQLDFNPVLCGERHGKQWRAKWSDDGGSDPHAYKVLQFRRTFELREAPNSFKVNVSADNRYILFVNGRRVFRGPARGDLKHWYFDEIDIAPHLKKGRNSIAALVWNGGEFKPCAQVSLRTAFILDGASKLESFISTPEKWKVKKSAAYTPIPSRNLDTGAGDDVDGLKYDWGWILPEFDDTDWNSARGIARGETEGSITGEISWMLTPRSIPPVEETPARLKKIRRFSGVESVPNFITGKAKFTVPAHTECSVLLDNGELTAAYPVLLVSGGKGATVEIKYAEALFDASGQKGNRSDIDGRGFHPVRLTRDIFRPDGGSREFPRYGTAHTDISG